MMLLIYHLKYFAEFVLRLVTLENSPCLTPELLRIFQNMSALLGKSFTNKISVLLLCCFFHALSNIPVAASTKGTCKIVTKIEEQDFIV